MHLTHISHSKKEKLKWSQNRHKQRHAKETR